MGIFRRRRPDEDDEQIESFAEQENNPELLEAEREVNQLPREDGPDNLLPGRSI